MLESVIIDGHLFSLLYFQWRETKIVQVQKLGKTDIGDVLVSQGSSTSGFSGAIILPLTAFLFWSTEKRIIMTFHL